MSFRGRYPSKFRRAGNYRGHERLSIKERGRPFKRKYHEERDSSQIERFREHVPIRGRGGPMEKERNYYSVRGRGRPLKKYFSGRGVRPPRSRGRFFRGRQGQFRGRQGQFRGKRFDSPRKFDNERSYECHGSPTRDWLEENEFVDDERYFDKGADASDEWFEGEEEEYFSNGEEHISFEHGSRSPLTIHRRFGSEEFYQSPERSRDRSRSRIPDDREHSFERFRSPVERLENINRRRDSIDRRSNFNEYRRSRSIEEKERFFEHQRSPSHEPRVRTESRKRSKDRSRRSLNRSLAPSVVSRSRESSFHSSEGETSNLINSRRSLERQIAFEKERLKEMLEREKRIHEKRSESSIERFLDDCKRSFDKNNSRSNSFDRREVLHKRSKRPLERSLSPFDQPRKFRGLENITIERGRSLERSHSPAGGSKGYKRRRDSYSPERHVSPRWRNDYRENNSDSDRRSRSAEYQRTSHLLSRNLSPDISYNREALSPNNSPTTTFSSRPNFLEQQGRHFLGERKESFLGEPERHFLVEPERPFLGEQERPFLEERERGFLEEPEKGFLGNRHYSKGDSNCLPNSREPLFERSLSSSSSHSRSLKVRNHFLGVGDGPFSENRSIVKIKNENDSHNHNRNKHNLSSIFKEGKFATNEESKGHSKKKRFRGSLELSPVSQDGSFEKREFSDYHETKTGIRDDLSPISETGSLGKMDFSQDHQNVQGLSPVSHAESLGNKKYNDKTNTYEPERPSSTDSMQKFLAELEDDDQSYTATTKDVSLMCPSNKTMNFNVYSQSHSTATEKVEYIPKKSSCYDFNKSDKLINDNNQEEKLFNAYEKPLLSETLAAYNENLFQGRYEQSSKVKDKKKQSKAETQVPSSLNILPMAQQTSDGPPKYQSYDQNYQAIPSQTKTDNYNKYLQNQTQQNPYMQFSRPNLGHTHAFETLAPLRKGSTIPPMPFQPELLGLNNNSENSQPLRNYIDNMLDDPMVLCQIRNISDQQHGNWQNQSIDYQNSPKQSIDFNRLKKNTFVNFNQSAFPAQPSQYESFIPSNFPETQGAYQPQSWPVTGAPKQLSINTSGKSWNKVPVKHNLKEVIVISDDEGQNRKHVDDSDELVKINNGIIVPTAKTIEKYKNHVPKCAILGNIFKGFVIYFGAKESSELQKDPIVVLQESFSSSEGFEKLDIEERTEYIPSSQPKQICELRWKELLLSRGEGDSRDKARQVAGIALINALAKTCYTIQVKYGYYNAGRFPKFMAKNPEKPGYYKMVKRGEIIKYATEAQQFALSGVDATHVNAVISFMDDFFQDQDNHCELIFGPSEVNIGDSGMEYTIDELHTMARHAANSGLQYRWFQGNKRFMKKAQKAQFLGVSRYFSPQALKRYLLAERGDTVRYRLFPPQGLGIDLLTPGNFYNPNMIKSIVPIFGNDRCLDFYSLVNESCHENTETHQGMILSNQPGSQWGNSGQVTENTNSSQIPRLQGSFLLPFNSTLNFQSTNPSNTGFYQSFQSSSPQEGCERNVPLHGGSGGNHGKWP